MDYENVLGEHKFPTYEELKTGLLRLIDEGKISREDAARLLPELRESEDERIIKTLQDYVKNRNWRLNGPTQSEVLAWLEKQKEQKPSWSEEDEKMLKGIIERGQAQIQWCDTGLRPEQVAWLKSIRPSWKPSEEQIDALKDAIIYVESSESNFKGSGFLLESLFNNLQKL